MCTKTTVFTGMWLWLNLNLQYSEWALYHLCYRLYLQRFVKNLKLKYVKHCLLTIKVTCNEENMLFFFFKKTRLPIHHWTWLLEDILMRYHVTIVNEVYHLVKTLMMSPDGHKWDNRLYCNQRKSEYFSIIIS